MDNATSHARATLFEERCAYRPRQRPGYAAWVSLFDFGNGELGLAVNEIRRGRNPHFEPPTLEFLEAMSEPYRVAPDLLPGCNRDLLSEYVSLKSADAGRTWQETGRCAAATRHYWYTGFPDGRLVRVIGTQHYRYEMGAERCCTPVEASRDGGTTWEPIARIAEGKFFYVHKWKKLSSGALLAVGPIMPAFGPGAERATRHTRMPGHVLPDQTAFFASDDGGHTWRGPHYILPGVEAWEPDFVELSDGGLLFVNSTVQAGRAVRQIVRRTATGWMNDPLMTIDRGAAADASDVQGGFTPETIAMRPDGLIVGARRGNVYSCSNDMGQNWHAIAGAPTCNYQPIIACLPDGCLLTAWHLGGDTRFGEFDMFIGLHAFEVEATLPAPTRLSLERELTADGNRYINAFRATLTARGTPAAGRAIEMRVKSAWLPQPDGRQDPADVWDSLDVRTAVTDEDGVARFALSDKQAIADIHHGYFVAPSFAPGPGDALAPCRGPVEMAYPLTPARHDPAPHPVYINHGLVMITPETAARFPELPDVVKAFNVPDPAATIERWVAIIGDAERTKQILAFLMDNHVIAVDDDGVYHWYRSVHSGAEGEPWIHEVRVCDLEEHCV